MSQLDLFGADIAPPPSHTTAVYPNRMLDKRQVEHFIGLPEHPDGRRFVFATSKGTVLATDYTRIVYGDSGPYVEFEPSQIQCVLRLKFRNRELPEDAYYEWLVPQDGSDVKVYDQKRDVKHIKNAPEGGFAGNREEGYADYVPGMIYISPWEMVVSAK